jgi:hypothetical protein
LRVVLSQKIADWIKENPDAHADRMRKINGNPEKPTKSPANRLKSQVLKSRVTFSILLFAISKFNCCIIIEKP